MTKKYLGFRFTMNFIIIGIFLITLQYFSLKYEVKNIEKHNRKFWVKDSIHSRDMAHILSINIQPVDEEILQCLSPIVFIYM